MSGPQNIVIVGAGCFGISTAYHLLKHARDQNKNVQVTVVDRAEVLPAPDAASTDLNKIVRSAYQDEFYTKFAREAIAEWKDRSVWGDAYHESGVLVFGEGTSEGPAFKNDVAHGARVHKLSSADRIETSSEPTVRSTLSNLVPSVTISPLLDSKPGYFNYDGGWAAAADGVSAGIKNVRALGGKVEPGKKVVELIKSKVDDAERTTGLKFSDGSSLDADLVILATGAWTVSSFPSLNVGETCSPTGQGIAIIELTKEEADRYRSAPVILDFGPKGFYMFPPTDSNVVKIARHSAGYAYASMAIPPRTALSHGTLEGSRIPAEEIKLLRDCLKGIYPDLAMKKFASTRLCWYTDSPDTDWVIDFHPSDPSLLIATSGSGHAYKFFPVIGRLVVERLYGTLEPSLADRFSLTRPRTLHGSDGTDKTPRDLARPSRHSVKSLEEMRFCTDEDLLP